MHARPIVRTDAIRIVVCIPSLNEADSIGYVVTQADRGLVNAFPSACRTILNVDSNSDDLTARRFAEVPTSAEKIGVVLRNQPRGKGRNLLCALRHAKRLNANCAVILDSDTTTITSEWVVKLASPIIAGRACFVSPVYARSRFEGSTTNHLAWPLVFGCHGIDLRQPIAGDFAMDASLIKDVLTFRPPDMAKGYGIDMFLSIMACRSNRPIEQVALGRKLHKPSFPKIERIFVEETAVGLELVRHAPIPREWIRTKRPISLLEGGDYAHREQAAMLLNALRSRCLEMSPIYSAWVPRWETRDLNLAHGLSTEDWTDVLAGAVGALRQNPTLAADIVARQLLPAFLLRTVRFWNDTAGMRADAAERILEIQAESFARAVAVRH